VLADEHVVGDARHEPEDVGGDIDPRLREPFVCVLEEVLYRLRPALAERIAGVHLFVKIGEAYVVELYLVEPHRGRFERQVDEIFPVVTVVRGDPHQFVAVAQEFVGPRHHDAAIRIGERVVVVLEGGHPRDEVYPPLPRLGDEGRRRFIDDPLVGRRKMLFGRRALEQYLALDILHIDDEGVYLPVLGHVEETTDVLGGRRIDGDVDPARLHRRILLVALRLGERRQIYRLEEREFPLDLRFRKISCIDPPFDRAALRGEAGHLHPFASLIAEADTGEVHDVAVLQDKQFAPAGRSGLAQRDHRSLHIERLLGLPRDLGAHRLLAGGGVTQCVGYRSVG